MNEPKKQKTNDTRRKLTLHSETLRTLDEGALGMLAGVVGGTDNPYTVPTSYTNRPSSQCGGGAQAEKE